MDLKRRHSSTAYDLKSKKYELNILMFKRLWRVMKIVFPSIMSMSSLLVFTLLVAFGISEFASYYEGLLPSRFFKAFINKDDGKIFQLIFLTVILITLISVIDSCKSYFMNIVTTSWRQSVCNALHRSYFSGLTFYKMNVTNNKLDNSDQRITQDVDKMCHSLIMLLPKVILFPFVLAFYSYKAYTVCGYYSLITAYVYIIVYGIIFMKVSSPIVKHRAHVEKCEGDFRFTHTYIRVNAEPIAFQKANRLLLKLINKDLSELLRTVQSVTYRLFPATLCKGFFELLQDNMAYIVIGISILVGNFQHVSAANLTSIVAKNHFYLHHSTSFFTDALAQLSHITQVAGTVHRIGEFFEEMEILSAYDDNDESREEKETTYYHHRHDIKSSSLGSGDRTVADSPFCVFDRVTVFPPVNDLGIGDSKPIFSDVSFRFKLRTNVLVTGAGNCGKTTVLRIIRGLWDITEGNVFRSNLLGLGSSAAFFQPQKIIFVDGCLKQQIQFPEQEERFAFDDEDDEKIIRYLHLFHLEDVLHSCGGLDFPINWNWDNILSPNESQRLALIRILYHKPTVVLIDDIFNGLERSYIEFFYNECKRLDLTVVSVGEAHTLATFHDEVLNLQ